MAALNHSLLEKHYGRPDIKVFEIIENNNIYSRLFYRSTGSGNNKFKQKFTDTLVPFYGMKTDKNNTLIKAIMKREEMYNKRNLFKWQLELLLHLRNDVDSCVLDNLQTLLDNYFNTPGEIIVSINDNKGFWKNNKNIINKIKNFLNNYKIKFKNITEEYNLNHDTSSILYVIDDTNMAKNWLETLKIVEKKRQEEQILQKFKKTKDKKNKDKKTKDKKTKGGNKKSKNGKKKYNKKTQKKIYDTL